MCTNPKLPHLTSPLIPTRHAFFTRKGGLSLHPRQGLNASFFVKDNPKHVSNNRLLIAQHFNISPSRLLFAHQVHSHRVCIISRCEPWACEPRYTPHADALVTKIPLIALGITTADCVPILLIDTKNQVIAAIHGGWRGLLLDIIPHTLKAMDTLGASRTSIRAAVGPCIGLPSYPIGKEILKILPHDNLTFAPLIKNQHHLNLPELSKYLLTKNGLNPKLISMHAHRNTFSSPQSFFSSRYAQHLSQTSPRVHGCQASLISLLPP